MEDKQRICDAMCETLRLTRAAGSPTNNPLVELRYITKEEGGRFEEIAHTIVNALAIISGVVCDGAKSSCAAKIASSVEAGFLGYYMYKEGNQFYDGDGFIKKGVENTIRAVGTIARVGMCETDKEIIHIMLDK